MTNKGNQTLALKGLGFQANLGILDHEIATSQPISVDVELNFGTIEIQPNIDQIEHVLDYRIVHDIIISECTEQHVNLLESLTGKLCQRLMKLPGVVGAKARITKLKIFDDCEVSIHQQVGHW